MTNCEAYFESLTWTTPAALVNFDAAEQNQQLLAVTNYVAFLIFRQMEPSSGLPCLRLRHI